MKKLIQIMHVETRALKTREPELNLGKDFVNSAPFTTENIPH